MDKTRTLPPLVRGRVTSVLEFFVDKIKFFRNILLLTDNFDLVLQVQWWGESLPALIRPKELQIENRILKNSQTESHYQCEKYDIKTTLELFESYLKTCEVLELSVLEVFENYVIGSAFLRDLINLLRNNNELISTPIFDYLGEEIGEVIIHVNFVEKSQEIFEPKKNKNNQISVFDYLDKKPSQDCNIFSKPEYSYLSLAEKTLFYDGRSTQKNYQEEQLDGDLQPPIKWFDFTKNEKNTNLDLRSTCKISKPLVSREDSETLCISNKSFSESLPKIETLSDSSKVLCFGLSSQKSKSKTGINNAKIKVVSKFNSNSIKCKSKSKLSSVQSERGKKIITKTSASSGIFQKNQNDLKKVQQFDSVLPEKFQQHEVLPDCKQRDYQSLSSKQPSNEKVLDYLFGCDMSKNNEERALNDFKNMSPSHNLVDSISQLCLLSENNSLTSGLETKPSPYLKKTHLKFDFNNPIERDYYEKFFSKPNNFADFEVAEFLNHPENNFKFGVSKLNEAVPVKKPEVTSLESFRKFPLAEEGVKKSDNENYSVGDISVDNRTKNCARCKYYKKLTELDTIIESLKHFEQKMIMYEKNCQNHNMLTKGNQFAEGS